MSQKIIILVLTVVVLSGAVVWMYTYSENSLPGGDPGNPISAWRNIIWPPITTPTPTAIPTTIITPTPTPTPTPTQAPPPPPTVVNPPPPPVATTPPPPPPPVATTPPPPPPGGNGTESVASMWLDPFYEVTSVGNRFFVDIIVNTGGTNVVAVSSHISFNGDALIVENIDTSDSDFSIEAENIAYPDEIRIARGEVTPGVNSRNAKVATITFLAKKSGAGDLQFIWGGPEEGPTRVIAQQPAGKDILLGAEGMSYVVE